MSATSRGFLDTAGSVGVTYYYKVFYDYSDPDPNLFTRVPKDGGDIVWAMLKMLYEAKSCNCP